MLFEAEALSVDAIDTPAPSVRYRHGGAEHTLDCDVVVACDGFHGIGRRSVPDGLLTVSERTYPFAWLGILADVPPSCDELIYAHHERGFALHSMRSPQVSRLYLQVDPTDSTDNWPDERIWDELDARFATDDGWKLARGPITEKGITPMRSFVAEPMRHGRLFLAGDAAHIVPPTGAKGLNLAVADVALLAQALTQWHTHQDEALLDAYSETALRRLAGRALLVHDDKPAARRPRRHRVRPPAPALAPAVRHLVRRGVGLARRELHRAARRLTAAAPHRNSPGNSPGEFAEGRTPPAACRARGS